MTFEAKKSAYSRYLGRFEFFLLEISHSEWDKTWRFVNNTDSVTVDGETWEPLPFKYTLNEQGENSGSGLSILNVDRRLSEYIKSATTNDDMIIKVWTCHYENAGGVVEAETNYKGEFIASQVQVGIEQINIGLALRTSLGFNIGTIRYSKNRFPNLYL